LITWRRDLTLEYVAQEPRLVPDATVATSLARDGIADHQIATISAALQLPPMDARIGNLSNGERRRVALAHALLGSRRCSCSTSRRTTSTRDRGVARDKLAAWPGALIVVTHDRYFLDRVATRILEVDRGKVYAYEATTPNFC